MIEGGVTADGQDRLIQTETLELAQAAGQAWARAHGVKGLHLAKPGRPKAHAVAANVARHKTFAPV